MYKQISCNPFSSIKKLNFILKNDVFEEIFIYANCSRYDRRHVIDIQIPFVQVKAIVSPIHMHQ